MSHLFTVVSAEQQEIVAGGRRRPTTTNKFVVAPVTVVQIAGIYNNSRGGRTKNELNQAVEIKDFKY